MVLLYSGTKAKNGWNRRYYFSNLKKTRQTTTFPLQVLEFESWDLAFGMCTLKFGIWILGFGFWDLDFVLCSLIFVFT
jgi:hypothetical protein